MLERRSFLIGAGALLTAAYVGKATAFSRTAGRPLILPAAKAPEETLFLNRVGWGESLYGENFYDVDEESDELPFPKWRVTLGPDDPLPPPTRTWSEHLRDLGYRLESPDEIRRVCLERHITPQQLDAKVDGYWWQDRWDNFTGPQARAFQLLKEEQLGSRGRRSRLLGAGELVFDELGAGPGDAFRSVHLKDDLTVSSLQARLIELNLAIDVKVGTLS